MAGITDAVVGLKMNAELRKYARWEYGTSETGWTFGKVRRHARPTPRRWVTRLQYWLNSFRGFAAFDIHRTDDRTRQ